MELNVPDHYAKCGRQPIDVMKDFMTPEAFEGFMVGNAIKYIMRYNFKDGLKDLKKCVDYVNRLIEFKEMQQGMERSVPDVDIAINTQESEIVEGVSEIDDSINATTTILGKSTKKLKKPSNGGLF